MPFTVYDAAHVFSSKVKSALAVNARTLILHNEDNFAYALRGGRTYVRSADAGGAGTYNKTKGFTQQYGRGRGLTWEPYEPQFDRAKNLYVDKAEEFASYLDDMPASIAAMADDFCVNYLGPEYDAVNIATLFSKVPAENIITTGTEGFELDRDNICRTLIRLTSKMANAGSVGPAAIFVEMDETWPELQDGLLNKAGAFAFTNRERVIRVETGFEEFVGMEAPLTVSTEISKWNQHYLIPVPSDRMNSLVTLLDGESEGQEVGHYVVGGEGNRRIRILAIPLSAGFTSIRYLVTNLLIPGNMRNFKISESEILRSMEVLKQGRDNGMFSNMTIENVAFNPYYDGFEYQCRIIYGADIFRSRRKVCFAIADEANEGDEA